MDITNLRRLETKLWELVDKSHYALSMIAYNVGVGSRRYRRRQRLLKSQRQRLVQIRSQLPQETPAFEVE